ncbi:hypothetical protein B0T16DRAFT_403275 [Cercophora newfieldiana]|uniref:Uncharacterized protein n=1 Tax=Cercophora newfieldiana TaxID=92897 RepID=A0AA40CVY6_9PEZI|nr:hypothetical protein B0T16DRAFT_403275 [Cercophora newfieldiana]
MDISVEAVIAIFALVISLPSSVFILWNCIQGRRNSRRRQATGHELLPFAARPALQWQDAHHDIGRLAARRLLSALIEIVVDEGTPRPTLRSAHVNDSGLGHGCV